MFHMYCLILFQLLSLTGATESGIVGGKVAKPHSKPYMASLQLRGQHLCGGMLIRENFVLTAAHCKQNEPLTVVLGAHDISKKEKSQQHIRVAKYHPHPEYTGQQFDYDIMLLELKNNATLTRSVKTIKLPKKSGNVPANIKCVVAGWGQTTNRASSNVLKDAMEVMQFSFECKNKWGKYFNSENMICTKFDKKNGGVCRGDSGGPLICNTGLQGLTAFTLKADCSDPNYPHVFTKVSTFLPWIKKVMN